MPGSIPVATVLPLVKQEPSSQQLTLCEDSDVMCLGDYVASEIVIDDTQSGDDSLIRDLEAGNSDSPHAFLNLIAGGTQEDEELDQAPAAAKYSNRTLERLQTFEPLASRQLREDRKAMAVTPTKRDPPPPAKEAVRDPLPSGVTTRRKFFPARPGPKSTKRKSKSAPTVEYLDDNSEPIGNETPTPEVNADMNDELSVFLSSQLIFDDQPSPLAPAASPCSFKMVRNAADQTETPAGNVCFLVSLQRVVFEKDFKFELYVNLPQYNVYHTLIDGSTIRPLLNINDQKFDAIIALLNYVEKYEYNRSEHVARNSKAENFIIHQLDTFFSTQIRFKFFQFFMKDDAIDCFGGNHMPLTHGDLTSAIDPEILQAMAAHKKISSNLL